VHGEQRLPIDVDELLDAAYIAGSGDPWAGYMGIKDQLVRTLEGAREPVRVLRARINLTKGGATA
jgi:hypothetical protein